MKIEGHILTPADREDPILTTPRTENAEEPRESLDSLILAGLVSP